MMGSPVLPYLSCVPFRLHCACYSLAPSLHGWRRRRRGREALGGHSRHLKHGRVEVHGDLRRHGIGGRGLQADRQGSLQLLDRKWMVKDVELRRWRRRKHAQYGNRRIPRDQLRRRRITLWWI